MTHNIPKVPSHPVPKVPVTKPIPVVNRTGHGDAPPPKPPK